MKIEIDLMHDKSMPIDEKMLKRFQEEYGEQAGKEAYFAYEEKMKNKKKKKKKTPDEEDMTMDDKMMMEGEGEDYPPEYKRMKPKEGMDHGF